MIILLIFFSNKGSNAQNNINNTGVRFKNPNLLKHQVLQRKDQRKNDFASLINTVKNFQLSC